MCVCREVSIYVSLFCVWLLNTNTLEKELLRLAGGGGGGCFSELAECGLFFQHFEVVRLCV